SYLAKGETCHPSDNLAPILAAAEYSGTSGRELMTALAVAYQVQCRLSDVAAVRAAGFDHTVQGAYAVAAGVARVLGLDASRAASAIAISGTAADTIEHEVAEGRQFSHDGVRHYSWRQNPLHADGLHQGVGEHVVVVVGPSGPQDAGDHINRHHRRLQWTVVPACQAIVQKAVRCFLVFQAPPDGSRGKDVHHPVEGYLVRVAQVFNDFVQAYRLGEG